MVKTIWRDCVTPYHIRRLEVADAAAFRALRLEGLAQHPEAFGASERAEAGYAFQRWVRWISEAFVLGGFRGDGQLVGCASLSPMAGEKRQHIGQFGALFVATTARGEGLASGLLAASKDAGIGRFLRIILTVNAQNAGALTLYERQGFTVYGRLLGAIFANGVYHDEVMMVHEMLQNSN